MREHCNEEERKDEEKTTVAMANVTSDDRDNQRRTTICSMRYTNTQDDFMTLYLQIVRKQTQWYMSMYTLR